MECPRRNGGIAGMSNSGKKTSNPWNRSGGSASRFSEPWSRMAMKILDLGNRLAAKKRIRLRGTPARQETRRSFPALNEVTFQRFERVPGRLDILNSPKIGCQLRRSLLHRRAGSLAQIERRFAESFSTQLSLSRQLPGYLKDCPACTHEKHIKKNKFIVTLDCLIRCLMGI